MEYPENDTQFEDKEIEGVELIEPNHYSIKCGGWSLQTGPDCPVEPKVGQVSRQYGQGIGSAVRGLFINGVKVWYRTGAEQSEYTEIQLYGKDAADWLERWDSDKGVWSISMGGLGPGYEQCIQITAAELLRLMLAGQYDHTKWSERDVWRADLAVIEGALHKLPVIERLGLSGAQFGAAVQLSTKLYMEGPRKVMKTPEIADRKIQVSRSFPQAA